MFSRLKIVFVLKKQLQNTSFECFRSDKFFAFILRFYNGLCDSFFTLLQVDFKKHVKSIFWGVLFLLQHLNSLTVCSYHVTYTFQSESTLYSCLNVKELFARSRREIWSLSNCNWSRTHNHIVHTRTLHHLATLCGYMVECLFMNYVVVGSSPVAVI